MRRSFVLTGGMWLRAAAVLAVFAGMLTMATGPASALGRPAVAELPCEPVEVSFRGIHRGGVYGCYYANNWSGGTSVTGEWGVCDDVDEPQETNIVRGEVVAAFSNGNSWRYVSTGWRSAPGDGAGCSSYVDVYLEGPQQSGWTARYVKITAQAPGKAEAIERPAF